MYRIWQKCKRRFRPWLGFSGVERSYVNLQRERVVYKLYAAKHGCVLKVISSNYKINFPCLTNTFCFFVIVNKPYLKDIDMWWFWCPHHSPEISWPSGHKYKHTLLSCTHRPLRINMHKSNMCVNVVCVKWHLKLKYYSTDFILLWFSERLCLFFPIT